MVLATSNKGSGRYMKFEGCSEDGCSSLVFPHGDCAVVKVSAEVDTQLISCNPGQSSFEGNVPQTDNLS